MDQISDVLTRAMMDAATAEILKRISSELGEDDGGPDSAPSGDLLGESDDRRQSD